MLRFFSIAGKSGAVQSRFRQNVVYSSYSICTGQHPMSFTTAAALPFLRTWRNPSFHPSALAAGVGSTGRFYSSASLPPSFWRTSNSTATANAASAVVSRASGVSLNMSRRFMRVNSKDDKAGGAETGEQKSQNEEAKEEQETQQEEEESTKKSEKKKKNKKEAPPKKTFRDHINDLLNDFKTHGFIYNSPNFFNFIIFTIFCLISTGSAKEQRFWMTYFGLNNENNVFVNIIFNFTLHSFLTENFLSMSYAMILLHSLAHALLPVMGSRNLFIFIMSTAFGSGALIYLFNISLYNYRINTNRRLIAEGKEAQEVHLLKQYGPWDVIHALFLMHYFVHGVGAIQVLNSFSSWVKYACWVGEICILYHNWQPTLAGTIVGLALCRAPMFKQYIKFMPGATPKV